MIKRRKAKKKRKKGIRLWTLLLLCVIAILFFVLTKYSEVRVMPTVNKTMEHFAVTAATKTIDASVKKVIEDSKIESEDLYNKTSNQSGKLTSLSADTVLINSLCASVSETVLEQLASLESEHVYLPLGILSGFDFLAERGPKIIKVSVKPMGECVVDYNTSFKSEGINQINYQIWLEVKTSVSAVNPLSNKDITVIRKVPVVNTYINGDVPESMVYPFFNPAQN